MAKKLRIGMVRADAHAYTFAQLMAPCDVGLYRQHCHPEYYWMIEAYKPDRLKTARVHGLEIVGIWDESIEKAERFSATYFGKPRVRRKLEEVAEGVDAIFINDCNLDGSDHLGLARPFLRRGLPVFVDKPFADCLANALTMVRLARRFGAPLYSSSILREVDEVKFLKARLPEIRGELALGVVKGMGPHRAAVIHGLSMAQGVFGQGADWVECMGEGELEHVLIHYSNGAQVVVHNTPSSCFDWFMCDVYTNRGRYMNPPLPCHLHSNPVGDAEYIVGAVNIVRQFKRMIQTREPPVPYEAMLELIAIVDAARIGQSKGKRVHLADIMNPLKRKRRLS